MKVQIVIPTINLWQKYTKPAIDSVMSAMIRAKSHGIDCHILLIDNASTDETKEEAPKLNENLFHYQRNDERWGFQKSVNFGTKYGIDNGAEAIFVLNNDILLHPEAIWRLVERLSKGDIGMTTCMDITGDMKKNAIEPQLIGTVSAKEKETIDEAPHPCFSAFMISKDAWESVGEFDEVFAPAYFEDNDYHRRMILADIPAIVFPPAMFYHYASRTQFEASEDGGQLISHGMFENARAAYVRKWGGVPTNEQFEHPYNDGSKTIKSVKQNS